MHASHVYKVVYLYSADITTTTNVVFCIMVLWNFVPTCDFQKEESSD